MIRVVLAENHPMMRSAIRMLLQKADDILLVGEAVDGQAALELVEQLLPDVLLIDLAMPVLSGLEATKSIKHRGLHTRVLIISLHAEMAIVRQALHNGAQGYVNKSVAVDELLPAIYAVHLGQTYISSDVS